MISDYFKSILYIGFAIFLLAIYIGVNWKKKGLHNVNLSDGIIVFISGTAIVGGVKLMTIVYEADGKLTCIKDGDYVFVFLGGLVIAWVSFAEFYKRVK